MTVAISEKRCSWNPSASITKGLQCCILFRAMQWKRELTCCRCSVESLPSSYTLQSILLITLIPMWSNLQKLAQYNWVQQIHPNPGISASTSKMPFVCTVAFTFKQIRKISCYLKALIWEESSYSSFSSWQPGCKGKDLLCRERSAGLHLFLYLLTWETKIYSAARYKDLKLRIN